MDTIISLVVLGTSITAGLGLLALAALRWGVDSRPRMGDDHAR